MQNYRIILIIGVIEILIGSITLLSNFLTLIFSTNAKSLNVLCFVLLTGIASTLIGIGLLKFRKLAYQLLLYFSSVIVISKILIFMDIIALNGALETTLPAAFKRTLSIFYHSYIIFYLTRPNIKSIFHR